MDSSSTVPIWVTLVGFAAPLLALAGSAVAYVVKLYRDAAEKKRRHFFELMEFIDSPRPIATKMAAVYELRPFPEHKDFIVRFCQLQRNNIAGNGAPILIAELDSTREFLERN
jgi:hypothetical protein